MTRKLFISADIEGCAAVASVHALAPDRWEWSAARKWMTHEVVSVAEAAMASGYDEVIVADGHGNAHNIDPDALPDNVSLIRSWPRPMLQMQGVDEPGVEACAFVGYHAGPGSPDSILSHIYNGAAFRSIGLNGEACSEGYLNAALAGAYGRPVILVAGDEQTIAEARTYAPDAEGFVSKHSIGWRSQRSLPPAQVCRQLGAVAQRAFQKPLPAPFVLSGPFHLEIETVSQGSAEMLSYLRGVKRTGSFGISTQFDSIEELMRFIAFATFYTPSGVPAL
nr:M55 family metallopeptidase [Sphingomonas sp. Y57]